MQFEMIDKEKSTASSTSWRKENDNRVHVCMDTMEENVARRGHKSERCDGFRANSSSGSGSVAVGSRQSGAEMTAIWGIYRT